ncbi:hypothetical protein LEP1GSC103_2765 [Leptospira borgpetersenii serovar Javanica str. UI 09931]|uniref:Uncharacterized protein n=1 Tax=Leptospira borgpetersenii serovar Javanica str. UI 09931 TaxID=1049767 RepID=A0AAV3JAB3_LEPBO|nr:hypothetical protein LEP1GSC121_0549 [Leptospira borgpetersenii serovar Castellonis str. 200801910]ENO65033.1 hypothetical protein LEP1GSC191_2750 [Leptospira borgpetersenii serovar Mini str. 201000851]EPG57550.1 hypothetical protein LEP1GSC103_2765 [Leptospira borgpetersenii serovar Javanica str. UI 09931]
MFKISLNGKGHKKLPFQIRKPNKVEYFRALIFQFKKETHIEMNISTAILRL